MNKIPGSGWIDEYLGGSADVEANQIEEALSRVKQIQTHVSEKQNRPIRRAFHNKGVVFDCHFLVSEQLPEHLHTGFLMPAVTYKGFGRFSRSQSLYASDDTFDQRGFGFRAVSENGNQDFLMSNTPASFAADPVTFLDAGFVFASSPRVLVPFRLIRRFGIKKTIAILKRVTGNVPKLNVNFLVQQYWSRTPFQINVSAVRYTAKPIDVSSIEQTAADKSDNALDHAFAGQINNASYAFGLYVQHFVDNKNTPLDRTDLDWSEQISPLVLLGTVTLPEQLIGLSGNKTAAQVDVENEQAFNPWTTQDIFPLGSMNRSRKQAYKQSAINRDAKPSNLFDED